MKVTVLSFAKHSGIPETTFRRWLKSGDELQAEIGRKLREGGQIRHVGEVTGSNRTAEMGLTIARGSTTPAEKKAARAEDLGDGGTGGSSLDRALLWDLPPWGRKPLSGPSGRAPGG